MSGVPDSKTIEAQLLKLSQTNRLTRHARAHGYTCPLSHFYGTTCQVLVLKQVTSNAEVDLGLELDWSLRL